MVKFALHGEDGKTDQLDDQDKAREYDGKNVRIMGPLDKKSMTIHVSQVGGET